MERIVVARVTRAHGLGGALLVRPETDHAVEVFAPGRRLELRDGPPGLPPALTVRESGPHRRGWRLVTEEIADRRRAEAYVGSLLVVPRDELRELEEGEFFLHELVGLRVVDEEEGDLGEVRDVYEAPATPLLSVRIAGKEKLIPFHGETVVEVDLAGGELRVRLPEGLLEV